jgi:hypothetical protein
MGCDILALDLGTSNHLFIPPKAALLIPNAVRNWEFLKPAQDALKPMSHIPDPRKMLRRRSSLVVDDLPAPKSPTEKRVGTGKAPAVKTFEEPDANSLLDAFGF